jgi:hypothetical protein
VAGHVLESRGPWGGRAAGVGVPDDRLGEGVFGFVFDRGDQRQQLVLVDTVGGDDVGDLRLAGANPDAKALAQRIATSQQGEIDTMNTLLARL